MDDTVGGRVALVDPDSPAYRAGVLAGDRVLAAGDRILADILDWQWESSEEEVEIRYVRGSSHARTAVLEREPGQEWGVRFASRLFDGVRTCANRCSFCFMAQLPPGARPSLRLRDDDFRLSFLDGNFITMTNLADSDVQRIIEQRLSPLYWSVHAVSPNARDTLMGCKDDRGVEIADRLLSSGLELHAQIVLVPGVNDCAELDATLNWLTLRPGVSSVGVVPVGLTSFADRGLRAISPDEARAVIEQLGRVSASSRPARGTHWVYAADELYLLAGEQVPDSEAYDDFPQIENGIGLVRTFIDDIAAETMGDELAPACAITGTSFASVLAAVSEQHGLELRVLPVAHGLFGPSVTVTGLLGGRDIARAVQADEGPGPYLVPDIVLNAEGVTLDDMSIEEVATLSGATLRLVSSDAAGLLEALRSDTREEVPRR